MSNIVIHDEPYRSFYKEGPTLLHRWQKWLLECGEREFLYYGEEDKRYSYIEFDAQVNSVANALYKQGVRKGSAISVLSQNAYVSALTMFAAWKLGALYCPINNRLGGELLAHIINEIQADILVVDQQFLPSLNALTDLLTAPPSLALYIPKEHEHDFAVEFHNEVADTFFTTVFFSTFLESSTTSPELCITALDPCSIIFTSGTTGRPKKVKQSHAWLHGMCLGLSFTTHPDDVLHCDLPLYHIGGAYSLLARAAWSGAAIALWDSFSPTLFWQRIRSSKASIAILLDVMQDWIMQIPQSKEDLNNPLAKVHMQPLPSNHQQIAQRFGFDFVLCGYGSTELGLGFVGVIDELGDEQGTPDILWKGRDKMQFRHNICEVLGDSALLTNDSQTGEGFMGLPVGLYEAHVINEQGQAVAADEPGQLLMRAKIPELMFYKLCEPADARKELSPDTLFHSADIVSYDEDGRYYFKGRKEGFLRVRGENISASQVEQQINRHPHVRQSAVLAVPARQGNEDDLCLFVVLVQPDLITVEELKSWSEKNLPVFMQPCHIRIIDEMPLTATNKIQKYKLREELMDEIA